MPKQQPEKLKHMALHKISDNAKRENSYSQPIAAKFRVSSSNSSEELIAIFYRQDKKSSQPRSPTPDPTANQTKYLPARATVFQKIGLNRTEAKDQ